MAACKGCWPLPSKAMQLVLTKVSCACNTFVRAVCTCHMFVHVYESCVDLCQKMNKAKSVCCTVCMQAACTQALTTASAHLFPSDQFLCEHELPLYSCSNAQAVQCDIAHIAYKLCPGTDCAESFGILLVQQPCLHQPA